MTFRIESDGIVDNIIKDRYGKRSSEVVKGIPQISFPLKWEGAPENTVSYAIVFNDYDNIQEE